MRVVVSLIAFALTACDCDPNALTIVPDPGTITGRVCDPGEGRGIFNARVWVVLVFGDGTTADVETTTDIDGNFTLEDVPVGTYDVQIARGSFSGEVADVEVLEAEDTDIAGETCIQPEVKATVYTGHDNVEEVLTKLGFTNFTLVDTHSAFGEHDEDTPSWLVEEFGDYSLFSDNDILFINCGSHEWAVDNADPAELDGAFANLRTFVAQGGSIYMSDWSYDLFEELWPDAVNWLGDDNVRNEAELGVQQIFVGDVVDNDLRAVLGRDRASLRYDLGRIAMPKELGPGSRAMITAAIESEDPDGGSNLDLLEVPVLLEHQPADAEGRVIYTTFHNGGSNTEAMDEVLRAIIFSL